MSSHWQIKVKLPFKIIRLTLDFWFILSYSHSSASDKWYAYELGLFPSRIQTTAPAWASNTGGTNPR